MHNFAGMAWSDDYAASRFHLRTIIVSGKFALPQQHTLGDLRSDATVVKTWQEYLETQPAVGFLSRGDWKRHIHIAQQWLASLPDSTDISMYCEIQMMLRPYAEVRTRMHEVYKIARASDPRQLCKDFVKYRIAKVADEAFARHGRSPFQQACRDGNVHEVQQLMSTVHAASLLIEGSSFRLASQCGGDHQCCNFCFRFGDGLSIRTTTLCRGIF